MTDDLDSTLTADLTPAPPSGVAGDGMDPIVDGFDNNGDGLLDLLVTSYADGSWDVLHDVDGDGSVDVYVADTNGDGVADIEVVRNLDGTYTLRYDQDADGVMELGEDLTRDQLAASLPGIVDALDLYIDAPAPDLAPVPEPDPVAPEPEAVPSGPDVVHPDDIDPEQVSPAAPDVVDGRLVGDPAGDAEHWFQQAQNGFCVPASVAHIVAEYTGLPFTDEATFVELANQQGLFVVGMDGVPGMTYDGALQLLESAGVPAELEVGTTEGLVDALEEGRRIMLFVDSGELWYGEDVEDQTADHAVVLTGIDLERGVAVLSDPGTPDGAAVEIPLELLEDAWADSQNAMIVADEPPADLAPAGAGTGAGAGSGVGVSSDAPADVERELDQVERTTSYVLERAWALLPVTLAAVVGAVAPG